MTGYLGLLLMGGCFIVGRPAHLEPDQEPDRRRHGHVRRVPDALGDQLDRVVHGADDAGGAELPVDHRAPRRLHERRDRHQVTSSTTSASSRSGCSSPPGRWTPNGGAAEHGAADSQHPRLGRHRPRLRRASVRCASSRPEWDQYAIYAAWAGLALVVLYTLGQWREIVAYFQRPNARYGAIASVSVIVVLGILVDVNYLSQERQQAVGPDREQAVQPVGAVDRSCCRPRRAGEVHGLRPGARTSTGSGRGSTSTSTSRIRSTSSTSTWTSSRRRRRKYKVDTYGTIVVEYMGRTERVNRTPSRTSPTR